MIILLLLALIFPLVVLAYLFRTVIVQPRFALLAAFFGTVLYLIDHH